MAESDIQAAIVKTVRHTFKWFVHKNKVASDGAPTGWPDLSVYIPGGQVVLIEVKKPGEVMNNTQRFVVDQLIKAGFPVYCVDNHGHAIRVLRKEYEKIHGRQNADGSGQ